MAKYKQAIDDFPPELQAASETSVLLEIDQLESLGGSRFVLHGVRQMHEFMDEFHGLMEKHELGEFIEDIVELIKIKQISKILAKRAKIYYD